MAGEFIDGLPTRCDLKAHGYKLRDDGDADLALRMYQCIGPNIF